MPKKKVKPKATKRKKRGGSEDDKQRRKYERGGRIEAYTFGEVTGKKGKDWPF